ncbi:MAG: aspartate aminotransferase family protein [Spirochaetes bacterium]|nr:aspartate aminotransferase family protein [Spirochaetota bacterium]
MSKSKAQLLASLDKKFLFQNYGERFPVCFTKGKNAILVDQNNKKYIDFLSGIAVSSVGYGHPAFIRALHAQIDKVIHTSNFFLNKEQIEAARLISAHTFPGKTLFVNSGAEANEAAIKLARRFGKTISPDCFYIITFTGSFHGRTYGSMSATGQDKIKKGFEPLLPGFIILPFNDFETCKNELSRNNNVCAVMTELIQGESGINIADKTFIQNIAKICKEKKILFIIDEVQTGVGRTGKFCAYQHYGIEPDILTFAKGLGGGVPIGAMHARENLVHLFEKGSHGTTFGGNHLACAAAVAVMKVIGKKNFLTSIQKKGEYIKERLKKLATTVSIIKEIRGLGLHLGIELTEPGTEFVNRALAYGLVINCTAERIIRIMPPLTIDMKTLKKGMDIFEKLFLEEKK